MFTKTDIEKYFNNEKNESLLFLIIGIIAIIVAINFFFYFKTNFYKGAAIPLVIVGLMLAIIGFTIYKRSDADRIRNVYTYDMNPSALKNDELPRMKKVMQNFVIYRWIEITLTILGIGLFFYYKENAHKYFWKGLGLTLAIMAVFALFADYFAEQRGKIYTKGLQNFTTNLQ